MVNTIEAPEHGGLMTAEEVAALLKVAVRSVWRYRSAGQLPRSVKIGSSVRWKTKEILAWIDAGCPPLHIWENRNR